MSLEAAKTSVLSKGRPLSNNTHSRETMRFKGKNDCVLPQPALLCVIHSCYECVITSVRATEAPCATSTASQRSGPDMQRLVAADCMTQRSNRPACPIICGNLAAVGAHA